MRLKNILFTIAATTWLFSSCSEETLVDGPVISGGEEATISATLSINSVETKAAANYEFPQDDAEKKINNYVIVVFDPEKANVVGLSYGEPDAKESFEVEVVAKCYGEKQPILTLVNLPSVQWEACKAYTTYQQFKDLAVEQAGSFKSSELIKIAEQSETLNKGQINKFDIKVDQLVARIDVSWKFSAGEEASFDVSSFKITGINPESDVVLPAGGTVCTNSKKNKSMTSSWDKTEEGCISSFSFYTYEKATEGSPIVIEITGVLKESAMDEGMARTFKYELNPVRKAGVCETTGLVHGNLYKLAGTFDLKERNMKWAYSIVDWVPRTTDVNVEKGNYLLVTPLKITMPNKITDDNSIFYQSSSAISISSDEIKVYILKNNQQEPVVNIQGISIQDIGDGIKGNIKVISPIPVNFLPRVIEFVVRNNNGLSEKVRIIQYPPLFLSARTTKESVSGSLNNKSMYIVNVLVANLSDISSTIIKNGSETDKADFNKLSQQYVNYLKQTVVIGYPAISGEGNTVDSDDNNRLMSPRFMLASHAGTTSKMSYTDAVEHCRGYSEREKSGTSYVTHNDWRLPTLAELYMIDYLQNVQGSGFDMILTGRFYWSSRRSEAVQMMDATTNNQSSTSKAATVRCVRDVKDGEM